MWFVQPAQRAHVTQQLVCQAVHHLLDVAEYVRVQATEIGHPRCRAHAAQKAVGFYQQCAAARARRRCGRHDARRATAQHHHVKFAKYRCLASGFGQGGGMGRRRHCVC